MSADNETVERRLEDALAELAATTAFQDDAWDRITRRYSDTTEPDAIVSVQSADTDFDDREGGTIMLETEERTGHQRGTLRRRSPKTWLLVAAAAVLVVVVGAVVVIAGGDEDPVDTITPPTTLASPRSDSTDQEVADEAVLVVQDMPEGWTAAPVTDGGSNIENHLDECGATDPSSVADDGDPRSTGSWESDGGFASSSVEINHDETQATAVLAALRTTAGKECLAGRLASSFTAPGIEVGEFELIEQPSEGLGDDSITFRAAVPLSFEGDDFIWFGDMTTIRRGRALVFFAFGQPDEPPEGAQQQPLTEAEQQRLTETVLERLPSDL